MTKTDAAAQTLGGINPDVGLESYTMNITTVQVWRRRGEPGKPAACLSGAELQGAVAS
jgi:hypothetical protein